jgi:hypothetical protein
MRAFLQGISRPPGLRDLIENHSKTRSILVLSNVLILDDYTEIEWEPLKMLEDLTAIWGVKDETCNILKSTITEFDNMVASHMESKSKEQETDFKEEEDSNLMELAPDNSDTGSDDLYDA